MLPVTGLAREHSLYAAHSASSENNKVSNNRRVEKSRPYSAAEAGTARAWRAARAAAE